MRPCRLRLSPVLFPASGRGERVSHLINGVLLVRTVSFLCRRRGVLLATALSVLVGVLLPRSTQAQQQWYGPYDTNPNCSWQFDPNMKYSCGTVQYWYDAYNVTWTVTRFGWNGVTVHPNPWRGGGRAA